jgi:hypothetical protein
MLQRTPPHRATARIDFAHSISARNLSFVVIKLRRRPTLRKSNAPPRALLAARARG